ELPVLARLALEDAPLHVEPVHVRVGVDLAEHLELPDRIAVEDLRVHRRGPVRKIRPAEVRDDEDGDRRLLHDLEATHARFPPRPTCSSGALNARCRSPARWWLRPCRRA